jgi:hypothetical protein
MTPRLKRRLTANRNTGVPVMRAWQRHNGVRLADPKTGGDVILVSRTAAISAGEIRYCCIRPTASKYSITRC